MGDEKGDGPARCSNYACCGRPAATYCANCCESPVCGECWGEGHVVHATSWWTKLRNKCENCGTVGCTRCIMCCLSCARETGHAPVRCGLCADALVMICVKHEWLACDRPHVREGCGECDTDAVCAPTD